MGSSIRVLVVDDSALMREMVCDFLADARGIEVVGTVPNGRKALEILDSLNPDVITLDVQMPEMDGLATLDEILKRRPLPVIMFSSLTTRGADVTLDALDRGALDYVAKPEGSNPAVHAALREELVRKVRTMAGTDVRRMLQIRRERAERMKQRPAQLTSLTPPVAKPVTHAPQYNDKCIALGISTGGPPALASLFQTLRGPLPPIVVVQHMPPDFTKAFAWRLNSISSLTVKEAESGDILQPNYVYIAQGGKHLHLRKEGGLVKCLVRDGDPVSGHKPSVDVMMKCAAEIYGGRCIGVVMTGMGRDGSDGCGAIRNAGGYALGQDEASSDVYGMNKVAFVEGNLDRQFHLDEAATLISTQVRRMWDRAAVGV
ncbi:MAG: chemotaxis response regulator protein-glutamate methylesterase [Pirellulales bacterium]